MDVDHDWNSRFGHTLRLLDGILYAFLCRFHLESGCAIALGNDIVRSVVESTGGVGT